MSVPQTLTREHFRFRSYQRKVILARQRGVKRFVNVWHRRAGKDRTWLAITLMEALQTRGVYLHVFPSLNQGRRDLWDNLISDTINGVTNQYPMLDMFPPEVIAPGGRNETEMQIKFRNGSIWQIMGADSEDAISRLRGPNPVGIVLSEYGIMLPSTWDVLSPVLAENGGWASFIYTPNGRNHGWDRYKNALDDPNWFCQRLTVEDTRRDAEGEDGSAVIPIEEIESLRRHGMREEFIQQEFYVAFEGFQHGTIYGDLLERARADERIGRFPYDPREPVGVCFDLGHSDLTALWFYQIKDPTPDGARRVYWIDYYEDSQKSMQFYAQLLREHRPYIYGKITLPWDGRIAQEYMISMGFRNVVLLDRAKSIQAEIDFIRTEFSKFYFDEVRCAVGLRALEAYHRKWDNNRSAFQESPYHDRWSHAADSLRTGVLGRYGPMIDASGKLRSAQSTDRRIYTGTDWMSA